MRLENSDEPSGVEGYPLRKWNISIVLLNDKGEEVPADIFSKVTYKLHESFGDRAKQGAGILLLCPTLSL